MNLVLHPPAELLPEDFGSKCWLLRHMLPRCESERCPASTPMGVATSLGVHAAIAALIVGLSAHHITLPLNGLAGTAGDSAITMVDIVAAPTELPQALLAPVQPTAAQKPTTPPIAPQRATPTEFFADADIAAAAAPAMAPAPAAAINPQLAAQAGTQGRSGGDAQFRGAPLLDGAAYLNNPPQPQYPAGAIARGEEGQVILRAFVAQNGKPSEVIVWQSSGYRLLDQAALRAVQQWPFRAAPQSTWFQVPVVFQLEG